MTETVPYTVLKRIDTIEVRRYPEILWAETENAADDSGFNRLFQYISGENQSRGHIPMTTPVLNSEKIPMTAPVLTKANIMAFALPTSYTKESVPAPTNPAVHITASPARTLAALRFSGHTSSAKVQEKTAILLEVLNQHHIQVKGAPLLMRYNSPFMPGLFRRNDVAVEITD
jgi:hypothetical protein